MNSQDEYTFTLSEKEKIYAEEYLNETEESRQVALEDIRKWIDLNPNLHVKPDSRSILTFLRGAKFNLEKTKTKLVNYYIMRRDRPEWFEDRNPGLPQVQELSKLGVFVPLKELNSDNQMVVIIRVAVHDPKKHKFDDVFKVGQMLLDLACKENEMAQIYGITAVFDMTGISLGHARQLSPGLIKRVVDAWQNYHCRPKHLEFINAPLYINVVLNIFKNYMSDKLKGRVRIHFNDLDALSDAVPKDILPIDYGGNGEGLNELIQFWHMKLLDSSEWFAEDEQYRAE